VRPNPSYIFICISSPSLPHIMPEFDRLYLDMNGIIHCSSHNNAEEELDQVQKELNANANNNNNSDSFSVNPDISQTQTTTGVPPITKEQIFQNVCYYLDRIVSDIVQPKEVVFLAIDGVAPRAKLNQQRSRRYRSGTEQEIEMHLQTLQRVQSDDGTVDVITTNKGNEELANEYPHEIMILLQTFDEEYIQWLLLRYRLKCTGLRR